MINIGIWFDAPKNYFGGINYFKNLLYALSKHNPKEVKIFIFFSTDMPEETLELFRPYARVVRTNILYRYSFLWFLNQIFVRILKSHFIVNQILKRYSINILSHSWSVIKPKSFYKIISWIPDFQYLHLPEHFEKHHKKNETKRLKEMISNSDLVILSSNDALKDFKIVAEYEDINKGTVMNFVSQPDFELLDKNQINLEDRFGLKGRYFYLPNQFWKHKNHIVVFKALKILKEKGVEVTLVCSGETLDFRDKNQKYLKKLNNFIKENNLCSNILVLGKIEYVEVLKLIQNSVATINPSFFEGWSSTVEESKTFNKTIILSNIEVHKEQNPKKGIFFSPENAQELAKIIENEWNNNQFLNEKDSAKILQKDLKERTYQFGKNYLDILNKI